MRGDQRQGPGRLRWLRTVAGRVGPDVSLPGTGLQVRDRLAQANVDQVTKGNLYLVRVTADLVTPARAGFLALDAPPATLAFLEGGAAPAGNRLSARPDSSHRAGRRCGDRTLPLVRPPARSPARARSAAPVLPAVAPPTRTTRPAAGPPTSGCRRPSW